MNGFPTTNRITYKLNLDTILVLSREVRHRLGLVLAFHIQKRFQQMLPFRARCRFEGLADHQNLSKVRLHEVSEFNSVISWGSPVRLQTAPTGPGGKCQITERFIQTSPAARLRMLTWLRLRMMSDGQTQHICRKTQGQVTSKQAANW